MLFMRVLRRFRCDPFRSCLRGSRSTHGRLNPVIGETPAQHRCHRFANLGVSRAADFAGAAQLPSASGRSGKSRMPAPARRSTPAGSDEACRCARVLRAW